MESQSGRTVEKLFRLRRAAFYDRSMPHSIVKNRVHVIFSTKGREKVIPKELQPRLWAFMGGIARTNGFAVMMAGGISDHAHVFVDIPAKLDLAKAVQLIKGGSSKWCNEHLSGRFAWQEGYYAISVSPSHREAVARYIQNQEGHHAKQGFEDELLGLLRKSGIEFDPNDVFG